MIGLELEVDERARIERCEEERDGDGQPIERAEEQWIRTIEPGPPACAKAPRTRMHGASAAHSLA